MPSDTLDIPLVIVEAIRPELARFCYYLENNKDHKHLCQQTELLILFHYQYN